MRKQTLAVSKEIKAKNQAIRRLQMKNRRLEAKNQQLSKTGSSAKFVHYILESVRSLLSPEELTIIENHLRNAGKKKRRYSDEFKAFCISASYKSRSCYKFLSRRLMLPRLSTVRRWISHVRFHEGFDDNLFQLLKKRVTSMAEKDKVCSLLMDEMSLKKFVEYNRKEDLLHGVKLGAEPGQHVMTSSALVFMPVGLRQKWRQAVSYFFAENNVSGANILTLVKECISRLEACGLRVVALTSDQGSNFSSMVNTLGVSHRQPFFEHEGKKIAVVPDPPHIIKSIRNALMTHIIQTDVGKASWAHIKDLFRLEEAGTLRLCPKLSKNHVTPPPFWGKMKVRLASQIFSHTVATAFSTYVTLGKLPATHIVTGQLCAFLNKVFDILNTSFMNGITPFRSGLSPTSTEVLQFLDEAIKKISEWKVFDGSGKEVKNKFRCFSGLQLALASVRHLTFSLCNDFGFSYVLTRHLCQDPLENYFGLIRQKNGFNSNPTILQFIRSFKQTICN
jgi:transposase-like protein